MNVNKAEILRFHSDVLSINDDRTVVLCGKAKKYEIYT